MRNVLRNVQLTAMASWPLRLLGAGLLALAGGLAHGATTTLADVPIYTTASVPGNVAFTLSVEYPTATSIGNGIVAYSSAKLYYGNFDPTKCYVYNQVVLKTLAPTNGSYFSPAAMANTTDHSCANASTLNLWSGNFLNWASMSTIDPFRWALTGGYRAVDTSSLTILEKSWAPPSQGGGSESPIQTTSQATYSNITPIPSSTWTNIVTTVSNLGQYMCFAGSTLTGSTSSRIGSASYSVSALNYSGSLSGATEYTSGATVDNSTVYCVEIRTKVCDATSTTGVENNCTQYPYGNYKPEGLIQKYAQQMRFADFGYLLDSGTSSNVFVRDGGVMRARMEYVGPTQPVPGATAITNPNAEWSASTGVFVANPDSGDASATQAATGCATCSIPNSGVINYINMFGEHARSLGHSTGYKGGDNVSELYYTALRYYKELGNVHEYTDLTATNSSLSHSDCVTAGADQCVDGFPVITSWYPADSSAPRGYDFPVQYACQKNFIIGIGDDNTHTDGNLPGTYASGGAYFSHPGVDASYEPPLETLVSATGGTACANPSTTPCSDTTVDTTSVTNWIGTQEGAINGHTLSSTTLLGQTPVTSLLSCCGGATFYIAGLAYDAHVHDLLPNVFQTGGTKSQIQTLSTYWVDVLEYGNYYNQNQYWMAAKYGGFSVPSGYTEFCSPVSGAACNATTAWPTSLWATQARTVYQGATPYSVPDNYFSGRDAAAMVSGLTNAFQSIAASGSSATSSGLSITTSKINSSNNINYSASYDPSDWTGDVQANNLTFDANGIATIGSTVWSARTNLQAQISGGTYLTARRIVTWNDATPGAVPFLYTNLSTTETTDLTPPTSTATAQQVVAYLRGDQSNEGLNGAALFRIRDYVLGDIVESQVVPVGAPSGSITAMYNPGYDTFQTLYANRATVLYVGANDGMLHAFDGSITDSTQGQELWAYIPGALYGGPSGTPYTNGLVSRTYKSFQHYNMVNATPVVADVDFNNAGGSFNATSQDWHTILVGGLGKGGMSYYAIDVTNPAVMTSEANVAGKVLWEFKQSNITAYGSSATIGYSFGQAVITKTAKYGWVVMVSSGYDNADGVGYIFLLNPKTGALLEPPISTGVGTSTTPSGLAQITTFVPNYQDGTSDALYAGDLLGNIWRVDLTPTTGNYAAPLKLATVVDPTAGLAQPLTIWPLVQVSPSTSKRYVVFGTGRTLSSNDLTNTQVNTIYSIVDGLGTSGGFYTASTIPSGQSFPVTRAQLQAVTSLLTGLGTTVPSGKAMGWYTDLASATSSSSSEQVDVQPTADLGIALFGINISGGSVCSPTGSGRAVLFDIATALSQLSDGAGNTIATSQFGSRVISTSLVNNGGTSIQGIVSTTAPISQNTPQSNNTTCALCTTPPVPPSSAPATTLNWREVKGGN